MFSLYATLKVLDWRNRHDMSLDMHVVKTIKYILLVYIGQK